MNDTLINQLSHRLETSTTVSERIDTLAELKTLCRTDAGAVAKYTLQKIIELLKEQGDADEYMEALEVITKLLKTKDKEKEHSVASSNASLILATSGNVELFLDLLDHDDTLINVMASDILSLLHKLLPSQLEAAIQACPEGMNKLLNRLPDSTREEVRNQALLLVQQLTQNNEEMKKTVAFNEGFDILFDIIASEGGTSEVTAVTLDCLAILRNILTHSEICQRLFYGMGGNHHVKLLDFFDISLLPVSWYEDSNRVTAAELSVHALANSITPPNADTAVPSKHQEALAEEVLQAVVQLILLNGPATLVQHCLSLVHQVLVGNSAICARYFDYLFGFELPRSADIEFPKSKFCWKPYSDSDQQFITLPALLAEKYIYFIECWTPEGLMTTPATANPNAGAVYLNVLNALLQAEPTCGVLAMQHVVAPPPPPDDLDAYSSNSNTSVVAQILKILITICSQLLTYTSNAHAALPPGLQQEAEIQLVRCVNVVVVMLLHGQHVAREIFTAITTTHITTDMSSQPLVLYLLSVCSKCMRLPVGNAVVVAVFRLLSIVASGCARGVVVMLDDPANLFVVDLATIASENAGVAMEVQRAACLFLGCCFHSLPSNSAENSTSAITRESILRMIDSKIGLTRFNNILRQPVNKHQPVHNSINYIDSYREYYDEEVNNIRQAIFDLYTGDGTNSNSRESQIIQMQKEHIARLEKMLQNSSIAFENNNDHASPQLEAQHKAYDELLDLHEDLVRKYDAKELEVEQLRSQLAARPATAAATGAHDNSVIDELQLKLSRAEATIADLRNTLEQQTTNAAFEAAQQEILDLKAKAVKLHEVKAALETEVSEKNRKLHLLEDNLRSPLPFEKMNTERVSQLEARNAELKQRVWELEAEVVKQKSAIIAAENSYGELMFSIGELNRQLSKAARTLSADESPVEAIAAKLNDLAAKCSDMAEGAGCGFESDEVHPLDRILECVTSLSDIVYETKDCLTDNATLKEQLKVTEEQLCALEGEHSELVSTHDALEIDMDECSRQLSQHQQTISRQEVKLKQLQHELDELKQRESVTTVAEDWQSKLDELQRKFDERAVDMHSQLCEANDMLVQLQSEKHELEIQLANVTEKYEQSQRELQSRTSELDAKLDEINELNRQIAELEAQARDSASHSNTAIDVEKMQNELATKQRLIDEMTERVQQGNVAIQRHVEELQALQQQCDQYAANNTILQQTINSEQSRWQFQIQQHIASSTEQIERLQQHLDDAVTTIQDQKQKIAELEEQLATEQQITNVIGIDSDDKDCLKAELAAKDQSIDELTSLLHATETALTAKEQTIKELQLEVAHRIEHMDAASSSNNSTLLQMTEEVSELRSQMENYERNIGLLTEQLEEQKSENDKLVHFQQDLQDRNNDTIKQLRQEIENLQQLIAKNESDVINSLQHTIDHLESECQLKAETIGVLQQRLTENDSQLEGYQNEVDELQNKLYQMLQESEQAKLLLSSKQAELEDMRTQLATEKEHLQSETNNQTVLQDLRQQLHASKQDNAHLQEQLAFVTAEAENKISDLQSDISHLSQELGNAKSSYTNLLSSYNELNVQLSETSSTVTAEYEIKVQRLQQEIDALKVKVEFKTVEAEEAMRRLTEYQNVSANHHPKEDVLRQQIIAEVEAEKSRQLAELHEQIEKKTEEYSSLLEKYMQEKEMNDSRLSTYDASDIENIQMERDYYYSELNSVQLKLRQLDEKYQTLDFEYSVIVDKQRASDDVILQLEHQVQQLEIQLQEEHAQAQFQHKSNTSRIEHLEGELKLKLKMVQMLQNRNHAEKSAMLQHIRDRIMVQFNSQLDHIKASFTTTLASLTSKLYKCQDAMRKLGAIVRHDKKTIVSLKQSLVSKNKLIQQYELTQQESFDVLRRSISTITTDTSATYYLSPEELNIILSTSSTSAYATSNSNRLMTSATQLSQLLILLLSAYRSKIKENKKLRKESEVKVASLERLLQEQKQNQWTTPDKTSQYLSATMPSSSTRLHTEMKRERRRLQELQEQHNDLLGLLAQQEVELRVFRDKVTDIGGRSVFQQCLQEAKRLVEKKYGTYVMFRGDDIEPSTPPSRQSMVSAVI